MNTQIKVSEKILNHFKSNNGKITVTTIKGNQHNVYLSKDEKNLYSYTGLKSDTTNNVLYLSWFDGMVDFIRENGGRVKKGCGRNDKVGFGKCTLDTLCGYIGINCYERSLGDSTFDPVFIVCAILEDAGICKNEWGYVSLNSNF